MSVLETRNDKLSILFIFQTTKYIFKDSIHFSRYRLLQHFDCQLPHNGGTSKRNRTIRRLKMSLGHRCHSWRRLERQLWNDRTSRAIIFPVVVLTTPKSIIPDRMLYDAPAYEKKDFSLKLASSLIILIVWLYDNEELISCRGF